MIILRENLDTRNILSNENKEDRINIMLTETKKKSWFL